MPRRRTSLSSHTLGAAPLRQNVGPQSHHKHYEYANDTRSRKNITGTFGVLCITERAYHRHSIVQYSWRAYSSRCSRRKFGMARLDSFRASVRFYRRSSVWLLYIFASEARSVGHSLTVERSSRGRSICGDAYIRDVAYDLVMSLWPNKSLQATRDGRSSSASRFASFGPACLSSGR